MPTPPILHPVDAGSAALNGAVELGVGVELAINILELVLTAIP